MLRILATLAALAATPAHPEGYGLTITTIYDGDTLTGDIDLGLNIVLRDQTIRLMCIDTPEVRGSDRPQGLMVRDVLRAWLADGVATVDIVGTGRYGRWLGWVTPDGWTQTANARLYGEGMAQIEAYSERDRQECLLRLTE